MNTIFTNAQEREKKVPIPHMSGRDKLIEAMKHQPKFDVVYADPPWDVNQKGRYGAINHYDLMKLQDIMTMPVNEMTTDDAVLFLWIVNGPAGRKAGEAVMDAWGFELKADFDWIKPRMGLGNIVRHARETMLIGTKGKLNHDFRGQQDWEFWPLQEHSHKPEEAYAVIERLYQNRNYLELFARKRPSNPNWYIWGDEAEGGSDVVIPGYPVPVYSERVNINPTDPDSPDTAKEA